MTGINGKRKMKILKLVFFAGCTINGIHIVFGWYFVHCTVKSFWLKKTARGWCVFREEYVEKIISKSNFLILYYGKDMSLVHYTIR